MRARTNVAGLLGLLAVLGVWEALVRSGRLDYEYLPAPSATARAAWSLLVSGELGRNVVHTLGVTLLGWTAAAVIGVAAGLLLGLSRTAWRYSMASLEALRTVPPISMVPLALLLFGFSMWTELTVIVYASAWPVMINTIGGVRGVRPELLDVARMLRLARSERIRKVILPAALPSTVVGLRLGLSLALVLAVVAEMAGNPSGLGNALIRAQQALRPDEMFAYVMTIGLLGVALNAAFRAVASAALPWLSRERALP